MRKNKENRKERLKILFYAWSGKGWMGGIYYIRNMVFSLLQNEKLLDNIQIFIMIDKDLEDEFSDMLNSPKITILYKDQYPFLHHVYLKFKSYYYNHIKKIKVQKNLLTVVNKYKIDVIFPMCMRDNIYYPKGIMWIPDMQHIHYPEFFIDDTLESRKIGYQFLAENHKKMILSSQSVLKDYKATYPQYMENVYVVPFVSALKESWIIEDKVEEYKHKYQIVGNYFMISNQYWKHKNHKIVFEAIHLIKKQHGIEIQIVCTGLMKDTRDQNYINELNEMIDNYEIENSIVQLGLISREAQIQIMKGAVAVIQPSLFEGWGTVVEDAKTLQKRIVLSDIDVHKEQANADCQFFERNNAQQLADILLEIWQEDRPFISQANYNYKEQAAEYGKLFYDALLT